MLGSRLLRSADFDPQNKPYVGLHTPDIDGDPAEAEFSSAVGVEHLKKPTVGER